MATFYRYRVFCTTEGLFHTILLDEGAPAPTLCPVDSAHTLNSAKTSITETIKDSFSVDALGNLKTSDKSPRDEEDKQIVTIYPASLDKKTFYSSAGDNMSPTPPDTGRGKGTPIHIAWDGTEVFPSTKEVELQFSEVIEVHDGEASWKPIDNFGGVDVFSFDIQVPASSPTSTPGAGNVNEVDLGGGMKAYIPAAGNGSHTVDLSDYKAANAAKPVPIPHDDPLAAVAVWKVNSKTGVLSAWTTTPGENDRIHAIFNFAPPKASIVRNVNMGSPRGVFEIEAYRVELGHPSWHYHVVATKTTPGAGEFNGWLLCYRKSQV